MKKIFPLLVILLVILSCSDSGSRLNQPEGEHLQGKPKALTAKPAWAEQGFTRGVILDWTDGCSNEDGYKIKRKIEDGPIQQLEVLPADADSFYDPAAVDSRVHTYYVIAYKYTDEEYADVVIYYQDPFKKD